MGLLFLEILAQIHGKNGKVVELFLNILLFFCLTSKLVYTKNLNAQRIHPHVC